jgi:hypothetical protein
MHGTYILCLVNVWICALRFKKLSMVIDKEIKEAMHVIVGSCYDVYKELRGGLLEKAYEDCLCYELRLRKHYPQQQVDVPLWYPQIRNPTKVSERCGPNRQECDFSSSD